MANDNCYLILIFLVVILLFPGLVVISLISGFGKEMFSQPSDMCRIHQKMFFRSLNLGNFGGSYEHLFSF